MFGKRLEVARKTAGHSVAEAASRAGITRQSWYKMERGEQWPRSEQRLRAVAAAVSVTAAELLEC